MFHGEIMKPFECHDCKFATADPAYFDECGRPDFNVGDPGEGHYNCSLLNKTGIWGEQPICTDEAYDKVIAALSGRVSSNP